MVFLLDMITRTIPFTVRKTDVNRHEAEISLACCRVRSQSLFMKSNVLEVLPCKNDQTDMALNSSHLFRNLEKDTLNPLTTLE